VQAPGCSRSVAPDIRPREELLRCGEGPTSRPAVFVVERTLPWLADRRDPRRGGSQPTVRSVRASVDWVPSYGPGVCVDVWRGRKQPARRDRLDRCRLRRQPPLPQRPCDARHRTPGRPRGERDHRHGRPRVRLGADSLVGRWPRTAPCALVRRTWHAMRGHQGGPRAPYSWLREPGVVWRAPAPGPWLESKPRVDPLPGSDGMSARPWLANL